MNEIRFVLLVFMKWIVMPLSACFIISGTACVDSEKPKQTNAGLERITSPQVVPEELAQAVTGCTTFGFELFRLLRENDQNLFFSPFSISLAMAMTYVGARNETEAEMASGMHFYLSQDRLHPTFNYLDLELSSRGQNASGMDGEPFRLNLVNSHWAEVEYDFEDEFLKILALHYGSGLFLVDFVNEFEKARTEINDWVEGVTEGTIKDLVPEGLLSPDTTLVIVNAIYFNAAWQEQFSKDMTQERPFYLRGGGSTDVNFMTQVGHYKYGVTDGLEAVEIPYDTNELSMLVLLPADGRFEDKAESLDAETLYSLLLSMKSTRIKLRLPKFSMEYSFRLATALENLGIQKAFQDPLIHTPGADFSGMSGTQELFISHVVHKAFVDIDENGTEASAATAVIIGSADSGVPIEPEEPIEVDINRPFLFLIRDHATKTVLFIGQVADPSK